MSGKELISLSVSNRRLFVGEHTLYFVAQSGGRQRYESFEAGKQGPNYNFVECSDGHRYAAVSFRARDGKQRQITISKTSVAERMIGYVRQPEPFIYNYVGLIPLREAILKAEKVGEGEVIHRRCLKYYFREVPGRRSSDILYSLDAETSIPLKVEHFDNMERFHANSPVSTWEALTFDEVQGYHLVLNSLYKSFRDSEKSEPALQLTNDYHVESIKFDEAIPTSTFWPDFEPGVFVNDLIASTSYFNTPDRKAPPRGQDKAIVRSGETPIAVVPTSDWTPWLSVGGVGLGLILLIVGISIRLKR